MKKHAFRYPMKKTELIIALMYMPIHIFLLQFLLPYLYTALNLNLTSPQANFIHYMISFLVIIICMFHFLRESFSDLFSNFLGSLQTLLIAYLFYYALNYVAALLLTLLMDNTLNPNQALIAKNVKLNPNQVIAVAVLLAPIVEEALFRGALFGSLRSKSRLLAYVVSVIIFSIHHLWRYFLGDFDWTFLLYMLQYIPGSIALAWCYERSGNIWTPIFLHMMINFISLQITIG